PPSAGDGPRSLDTALLRLRWMDRMPRIAWIDDASAAGDLGRLFDVFRARSPTGAVPPILRTMSQRPDFLAAIDEASQLLHFSDGALTRAQHEMIASYVAALNRCRY